MILTSIHISIGPRFIFKDQKDFVWVSRELFLETVSVIKLSLKFSHVMAGRTKAKLVVRALLKDGKVGKKKYILCLHENSCSNLVPITAYEELGVDIHTTENAGGCNLGDRSYAEELSRLLSRNTNIIYQMTPTCVHIESRSM